MKTDGRKMDHKELTEIRKRAVNAVQEGESPEVVSRVMGINRTSIYNWLSLYRSGGWRALDAKKRGGRKPKVNGKIIKWIYEAVTLKEPRQFKFPFVLWTSKMLKEVIFKKWGISLSKASICRLLNQLGLSAQKPLWRAYQQDPERVQKWLKEEYPAIKKAALKERAQIWFADEAGVRSDYHSGTTWAEKGVTPIVSSTGARFGLNMISAVSNNGSMRFKCVQGKINADVFIEFLKGMIKDCKCKIYMIVDGHPTHKAKKVTNFVEANAGFLKLFYLPPYSPELNPDEYVWNELKNNCVGRMSFSNKEELKESIHSFLRSLQKLPDKIMSYFCSKTTAYAYA